MTEIVIKIPDKVYDYVNREWIESDFDSPLNHVMNGVKNGTELPKGHGELKDGSKLPLDCGKDKYGCDRICHCDDCIYATLSLKTIKDAETLVEADKGE